MGSGHPSLVCHGRELAGDVTRMFPIPAQFAAQASCDVQLQICTGKEPGEGFTEGNCPFSQGFWPGSKETLFSNPSTHQGAHAQLTGLPSHRLPHTCSSKHKSTFPPGKSQELDSPPVIPVPGAGGAVSDASSTRKGSGLGPHFPQCCHSSPRETSKHENSFENGPDAKHQGLLPTISPTAAA